MERKKSFRKKIRTRLLVSANENLIRSGSIPVVITERENFIRIENVSFYYERERRGNKFSFKTRFFRKRELGSFFFIKIGKL